MEDEVIVIVTVVTVIGGGGCAGGLVVLYKLEVLGKVGKYLDIKRQKIILKTSILWLIISFEILLKQDTWL